MLSRREHMFVQIDRVQSVACPVCTEALHRSGDSLVCFRGHTLNANRKGYLYMMPRKVTSFYSAQLFAARQRVLESGFFDDVIDAILSMIPDETCTIADCGCGEGWWLSRILASREHAAGIGIDLCREAIENACARMDRAVYMVSDLRHLPILDHTCDLVLNILSPASYEEFARILVPDGLVIKVFPGTDYLKEIRDVIEKKGSEQDLVGDYMRRHLQCKGACHVKKTCPVSPKLWEDIVHMTPLTQTLTQEDLQSLDKACPGQITLDLHVVSGTPLPTRERE